MRNEPISTLMQVRTWTIGADDGVATIEAFLNEHGLSWAPVVGDGGDLMGVISLTDLLRFHREGRDSERTAAWQLCTYRPVAVSPDTAIGEVARLMVDRHIHHVVVTDRGAIRGVVSALDFVKTFV